jgi:hypothetical protein
MLYFYCSSVELNESSLQNADPKLLQDIFNKGFQVIGTHETRCRQGCQMLYFHTKNPNLGKF